MEDWDGFIPVGSVEKKSKQENDRIWRGERLKGREQLHQNKRPYQTV